MMKVYIRFFVVAVWLLLPTEGTVPVSHSSENDIELMETQSDQLPGGKNDGSSEEDVFSDIMKVMLFNLFTYPYWKKVMVLMASPEDLENPTFVAKWELTDDIVNAIKEDHQAGRDNDAVRRVVKFAKNPANSKRWRGLIALSSTRAELMDPEYRAMWGLGENIPNGVRDSSDDDNFFVGPQFNEFLTITDQWKDVNPLWSDRTTSKWLEDWIMSILRKQR